MFSRSIGWIVCLFVAVASANNYREPVTITGTDPGVTVNRLRTNNPEWSIMKPEQKFEDMAGSTLMVVDRAVMPARSPGFAAMLQLHVEGTSSAQIAVPIVEDPILRQLTAYLHNLQVPQLPSTVPQPQSATKIESESNPMAECEQQVQEQLSAETTVATAVHAIKHSCDSTGHAAIDFIKDHLGEVLASQGWAHAVRSQPEEVTQLSRLLSDQLAAVSMPTSVETRTTPTAETDSDDNGSAYRQASAVPPTPTCPATPLDQEAISSLRSLSEEEKDSRLLEATKNREIEELRTLLAAGASQGEMIMNVVSLQWAALRGYVEGAACLLDAGAPVDAADDKKYQPLHYAAIGGNPAVVRLLVSRGADPNARDIWGFTPLHLTVRDRNLEAAQALLDAGADREVRNGEGLTPRDMAWIIGSQPLIDILTRS